MSYDHCAVGYVYERNSRNISITDLTTGDLRHQIRMLSRHLSRRTDRIFVGFGLLNLLHTKHSSDLTFMKKYKELVDSTVIVVVAMLLLSGYIAGWEFVLQSIVGFIAKTASN